MLLSACRTDFDLILIFYNETYNLLNMKKFYTILAAMLFTLGTMAQTEKQYTENLVVCVNEESTEAGPTTVTVVDNGDGTYDFRLKNFVLYVGGEPMPVGNIEVTNIPSTTENGITHLECQQEIEITEGDLEDAEFWAGPMLGVLPLNLKADMTEDRLYAHIDLDLMDTIGQVIEVILGSQLTDSVSAVEGTASTVVYSVSGIRTVNASKGLYIVNGRKVAVK